ncbi:MAG: hypothetical protein RLY35_1598 [Bacteroidota bacterium]
MKNKKTIASVAVLIILSALAVYYYNKNQHSSIAENPFTQFAITDTSSVTKIFIADNQGNTALLERPQQGRLWTLNKRYKAREDALKNLLQVVNRIKVRGNVSSKSRDNMMKVLGSSAKKVEIYVNGENEPSKIYYVGPNTQDHTGTIMLLEIPDEGKSPEPYICHMEGFTGFLNPRFFAEEMEWRYTGIFDHPKLDIAKIEVQHSIPEYSFDIKYNGGNQIALLHNQQNIEKFDSVKVKDFLLSFKKVHIESYRTFLKPEVEDSIRKIKPIVRINVLSTAGKKETVALFLKRGKEGGVDANGNPSPWDAEYFWAMNDKGEIGLAQRYVFDPITLPFQAFIK